MASTAPSPTPRVRRPSLSRSTVPDCAASSHGRRAGTGRRCSHRQVRHREGRGREPEDEPGPRTAGDDRARVRTRLLELFELFDPADPDLIKARRDLASALY